MMKNIMAYIVFILLVGCQNIDIKNQLLNKNTPEYKAFSTQEHRFELNGCELKYNDKSFGLGVTLEEFEDVFGNDYKINNGVLQFANKNIIAWYEDQTITGIKIFSDSIFTAKIIISDQILNSDDRMQDFIKRSLTLSFNDFSIKSDGYTILSDNCDYEYVFDSPVIYERSGEGHLYAKGDWKLDETNLINAITVYRPNK